MKSRLAPALAAAACCFAVSACGSHTATKNDVIARANGICANALRDIRATPSGSGGTTSLTALAAYLRSVLPILKREASDLRALPKPANGRPLLHQYLSAVGRSTATYRALTAAAARGDQAAVNQALAQLRANPASALAARYGLSQCAGTVGTAVSR